MRFFHFIGRNHVVHLSSCSFKLLLSYFTHGNMFQLMKIKGSELIFKVLAGFFPHFWVSWEEQLMMLMLYWWVIFHSYIKHQDVFWSLLKCNRWTKIFTWKSPLARHLTLLGGANPQLSLRWFQSIRFKRKGCGAQLPPLHPMSTSDSFMTRGDKRPSCAICSFEEWLAKCNFCWALSQHAQHFANRSLYGFAPIWVAGAPKPSDHHRYLFVKDSVSNRSTRCEWLPNYCNASVRNGIWWRQETLLSRATAFQNWIKCGNANTYTSIQIHIKWRNVQTKISKD